MASDAKTLAGKSALNRNALLTLAPLELTAPDYDGSARRIGPDKPRTKKITVDPESVDALFNALSTLAPLDATGDKLYGQQEGRFFQPRNGS